MEMKGKNEKKGTKGIRLGIKPKILLFLTFVIVPFMALISGLIYQNSVRRSTHAQIAHAESIVSNMDTNIDSYISELSVLANECNYSYYLQQYLRAARKEEGGGAPKDAESLRENEMIGALIETYLQNRSDTTVISIYGKDNLLIRRSIYSVEGTEPDPEGTDWYREAVYRYGGICLSGPDKMTGADREMALSSMIRNSEDGAFLGVIRVNFNLNRLSEIVDNTTVETDETVGILNEKGELIYEKSSGHRILNRAMLKALREADGLDKRNGSYRPVELCGVKYHVTSVTQPVTGWRIVDLQPRESILREARNSILPMEVVVLLIFSVILILLNTLLNHVVDPIVTLQKKMKLVTLDNARLEMPVQTNDELGMLVRNFNQMTDRIDKLSSQLIEEQKKKRQYELRALQAQINPHFLYNTLDSIIWMAELQDPDVVPMTEALARLMRLALNKGREFITVEDEMNYVRNYLLIQSMRYQDKFDYQVVTDEAVRNCITVKLIVQPLVENSIYHGIKEKRGKCHLEVRAFRSGADVLFTVQDDGKGMDAETCARILTGSGRNEKKGNQEKGSGIGVFNVNERIQLEYGPSYGVRYQSEPGKGTLATIRIPYVGKRNSSLVCDVGEHREASPRKSVPKNNIFAEEDK